MKLLDQYSFLSRRDFFKTAGLLGLGTFLSFFLPKFTRSQDQAKPSKPETNIKDALKHARNKESMPGKYPGKVIRVNHENCVKDAKPIPEAASRMVSEGMLALTGATTVSEAWARFVSKDDIVGIKVNPTGGKELSTSLELVTAVVDQLKSTGMPAKNIVIWDRRLFDLEEVGFTPENFPGVRFAGTEVKDKEGSFRKKDGSFYSEDNIDREWYYWADVDGKYDEETLPYMVNEGKYSYFSKICTQEVDKIINIPILKNAGPSVTLCMKNLAYGAITNTGRLHKDLWSETSAEVCAFPPLRDKVVLNIVDGIRGCYQGGPGANPQYITDFKCLLLGTDPVAVDRIGYDIIQKKRKEEDIQKEESPRGRKFMLLAQELGLGTEDIEKIKLETIRL